MVKQNQTVAVNLEGPHYQCPFCGKRYKLAPWSSSIYWTRTLCTVCGHRFEAIRKKETRVIL